LMLLSVNGTAQSYGVIPERWPTRRLTALGRVAIVAAMSAEAWDWSRRVFDHVDVHASNYRESVRFYETVLSALGIPRLN
jgi:hypothetical protein